MTQTRIGKWVGRARILRGSLELNRPRPERFQYNTLKRLLWAAQGTALGEHYGFDAMLKSPDTIAVFQATVPFNDYDSMFRDWWHRSLEGEDNVAWPGHIPFYALSSGTTGAPSKYIPVSKEMLRSVQKAGVKCFFSMPYFGVTPDFYSRKIMMLGGSTSLNDMGNYRVGDLSGINIGKTPFWLRLTSKPDPEIAGISDWEERLEQISLNAHKWDIGSISGSPAWNRLMLHRIMEHNKVQSIHEVWPNLRVFAHGGVSFEPYRASFDAITTKPMAYIDTYLASEGFIAFQSRPDTHSMSMVLNNGLFFEFIPFEDRIFDSEGNLKGHPKALTINEVEKGKEYALVMSTNAGAWRYLIGDTVRFTNVELAEIIITGRTKHFMSICGEHLSVANLSDAICLAQQELEVPIPEFALTARADGHKFMHTWYIGAEHDVNPVQLQNVIDKHLSNLNDDYRVERSAVLSIEVKVLPLSVFYGWLERLGKSGGQHKFPRILKGQQLMDWQNYLETL